MRKTAAALIAVLLPLAPAQAEGDSARIAAIAEADVTCVLSASKGGSNLKRFTAAGGWIVAADGQSARHNEYPVAITLPPDPDGVARICEVRATMASQSDQKEMLAALEVLLRQEPIKQSNSMIWMFGKVPAVRGLQFFPDDKNSQPEVRFVGAAF